MEKPWPCSLVLSINHTFTCRRWATAHALIVCGEQSFRVSARNLTDPAPLRPAQACYQSVLCRSSAGEAVGSVTVDHRGATGLSLPRTSYARVARRRCCWRDVFGCCSPTSSSYWTSETALECSAVGRCEITTFNVVKRLPATGPRFGS